MSQGNHPDHPPVEGGYTGMPEKPKYDILLQLVAVGSDSFYGVRQQVLSLPPYDSTRTQLASTLNSFLGRFGLTVGVK